MGRKIRVLIAKPGLDGHDRGAKIVSRALRDAGMEVIFTGLHQTPEQIVQAALQEDVDAIGLSIHSGAHESLCNEVIQLMRSRQADDISIFAGGIIPEEDAEKLRGQGIEALFGPGTHTDHIIQTIQEVIDRNKRIKKIDHIGIAVKNLDQEIGKYQKIFGLKSIKIETLEPIKVRIAFIPVGEVLVELLEPTEPGAGRIGQFIEEKGEGFHHLAYRVDDIEQIMEQLRQLNVPFRDKEPRDGGDDSRIAFIEPAFTQNVLIELVERKREIKRG